MKRQCIYLLGLAVLGLSLAACKNDPDEVIPDPETCYVTQMLDDEGEVIGDYTYDSEGRLIKADFGDDYYFDYVYAGNKVVVTQYNIGSTLTIDATIDDYGNLESIERSDELYLDFYYDDDGKLEEIHAWHPEDEDENYVKYFGWTAGNITSVIKEFDDDRIETQSYTYNSAYPNKGGIFHFHYERILHIGAWRIGTPNTHLVKNLSVTRSWDDPFEFNIDYVLNGDGYLESRTINYIDDLVDLDMFQRFVYTCE